MFIYFFRHEERWRCDKLPSSFTLGLSLKTIEENRKQKELENEENRKQKELENEEKRKQTILENDEKRKQTEFVNNEKRKKELHQLKKKRSRDVSNKRLDPKPMPPMVMRMKKLLSDALSAANSFTIKCLTPRCVCKISPLS